MQGLARAQEQDPVAFSNTADGIIRSVKSRPREQLNLSGSQAGHLADVTFHPNRISLHFDIQRGRNDLCGLFSAHKWTADRQIEFCAFRFPAFTQGVRLSATRFGEWIIRLSLPA